MMSRYLDYVRRFRNTRSRCYSLVITERDMADLVLNGLRSHLKEKLEGYEFLSVGQVQERALVQESRANETKDSHRMSRGRLSVIEHNAGSDEEADVYAAEFVWPAKAKPYVCDDLKPVRKNREEEFKCSFDVGKCDKIFDALLKDRMIKISHVIPSPEELKRRAYCKYHHSYSHATNDCNVFRRQIQSALNDGRLSFAGMAIDQQPFPMNALDLEGKKVLIRPEAAGSANKANVVVGEPRNNKAGNKVTGREVTISRQPGGREVIKITISNPTLGGQQQEQPKSPLKFIKPKNPEVGQWKVNAANAKYKRIKPTFDVLLNKYVRTAGSSRSRHYRKRARSPPAEEFSRHVKPAVAKIPPWKGTFDKSRLGSTSRLKEHLPGPGVRQVWRAKPQSAEAYKPQEEMAGKSCWRLTCYWHSDAEDKGAGCRAGSRRTYIYYRAQWCG